MIRHPTTSNMTESNIMQQQAGKEGQLLYIKIICTCTIADITHKNNVQVNVSNIISKIKNIYISNIGSL